MAENQYRTSAVANDSSWTSFFWTVAAQSLEFIPYMLYVFTRSTYVTDDPTLTNEPISILDHQPTPDPTPSMTKEEKLEELQCMLRKMRNLRLIGLNLLEIEGDMKDTGEDFSASVKNYIATLSFYENTAQDWILKLKKVNRIRDRDIAILKLNIDKFKKFNPLYFDCKDMKIFNTGLQKDRFFSRFDAIQIEALTPPCNLRLLK